MRSDEQDYGHGLPLWATTFPDHIFPKHTTPGLPGLKGTGTRGGPAAREGPVARGGPGVPLRRSRRQTLTPEGMTVALRLLPREQIFFDLFNQTASNVLAAARRLQELLDDYHDVDRRAEEIKALEEEGDDLTHAIIERLNRTFVVPLDREDIFALAKQLDDVLDWIEASSARMAVYRIPHSTSEARELAHIIVSQCEAVAEAVSNLRRLDRIEGAVHEINRLENLADRVQRDAIARLFIMAGDPIEVIKWKELYETLEEATDQCEHVAHLLQGIRAKNL